MSIMKRGAGFSIKLRHFGTQIVVSTPARIKTEAVQIERAILTALKADDYRSLWPDAREVCIKIFKNQGWTMPPGLGGQTTPPTEELTLWSATQLFFKYPEIREHTSRWRYEIALCNITERLGQDVQLKSIWVPTLKGYQIDRLNKGISPDTINWELSALSRLFRVMMDLQIVDTNPCRLVRQLSVKEHERQVYLSMATVTVVAEQCPEWYRPIVWAAYYSGMRRGELLGLTRSQVDASKRIITLSPSDVKESRWKRVPIHRELVPTLEEVLSAPPLFSRRVFGLRDKKGLRDLDIETFKNVWSRACEKLQAMNPKEPYFNGALPRFHDLRHTWKTNARRSGMHPEIEKAIMGHSRRGRSVHERYGFLSDAELVQAIDRMTFDHGDTVILGGRPRKGDGNILVTSDTQEKKRSGCNRT